MENQPEAPVLCFNVYDQRFKLCCCHIARWTYGIGCIELVIIFFSLANEIDGIRQGVLPIWNPIGKAISIIIIIMLLHGIRKERPNFLIPHMIMQVLFTIAVIAIAIFFFVQGMELIAMLVSALGMVWVLISGIIMIIAQVLNVFFFYVIIRCYQFLRAKQEADASLGNIPAKNWVPLVVISQTDQHLDPQFCEKEEACTVYKPK